MNALARLWQSIADIERRQAYVERHGRVAEYSKGLARIEFAKDANGQPVLSPWIRTNSHHGFEQEHVPLKVGQMVTLRSPGGQIGAQSTIHPYSWNDENKRDEELEKDDQVTQKVGDLYVIRKADAYEVRLKEVHIDIGSGGEYVRGRYGEGSEAARFAAWEGGSKLRKKDTFLVVVDGQIIVSTPPIVGADPKPEI